MSHKVSPSADDMVLPRSEKSAPRTPAVPGPDQVVTGQTDGGNQTGNVIKEIKGHLRNPASSQTGLKAGGPSTEDKFIVELRLEQSQDQNADSQTKNRKLSSHQAEAKPKQNGKTSQSQTGPKAGGPSTEDKFMVELRLEQSQDQSADGQTKNRKLSSRQAEANPKEDGKTSQSQPGPSTKKKFILKLRLAQPQDQSAEGQTKNRKLSSHQAEAKPKQDAKTSQVKKSKQDEVDPGRNSEGRDGNIEKHSEDTSLQIRVSPRQHVDNYTSHLENILQNATKNEKDAEIVLNKPWSEKSPSLILYLVGMRPGIDCDCDQTSQFCEGNRQKAKALERSFMACVRDTAVWVFASYSMEQYLDGVRAKYTMKKRKTVFFFHDEEESAHVVDFLRKLSEKANANLVLLLLNGDKQSCLSTAREAHAKQIPVIVIKGSGGYADALSKKIPSVSKESGIPEEQNIENIQQQHRDSQDDAPKTEETKSRQIQEGRASSTLKQYSSKGPTSSSNMSTSHPSPSNSPKSENDRIEDTIAASDTLRVFDLDRSLEDKRSLCMAILDAIFKKDGKGKEEKEQDPNNRIDKKLKKYMELALSWECTEKAEEMKPNTLKRSTLNALMEEALKQGNVQFAEIFLGCGVNLQELVKKGIPENLCNAESEIFDKLSPKREVGLKEVVMDLLDDICAKSPSECPKSATLKCPRCQSRTSEEQVESPELRLFLWALLFGKFELAEFLWKEVQDHMTAALIACVLLRAMRSRVTNDINFEDEEKEMVTYLELFEGLAVKTLNNLYKEKKSNTFELLARMQDTEFWKEVTCLEIAERARCRKFIAQEACQNFADHIWRGTDPFSERESNTEKEDQSKVFLTQLVFFISSLFVIIPRAFMEFSQNKRGPAQLRYAITGFSANWPHIWRAPSFKFYVSWFCFIGFLLLYAYVLMVRIPPRGLQLPEIALLIWFWTLYVEEFRVCLALIRHKSKIIKMFLLYQLGFLNATNYYLAMLGIILWINDADSFALHVVLCLNFMSFIVRLFQYLSINSQLGPKVFMIKRMIKEIILFSVILMIIFLMYGVIKYSIDNGGQGVINSTVVLALPVEAFWLMLADRPSDDTDTRGDDDPSVIFRGLLRVAYLFFTTILLINLLIATFSYVFEVIHNQKDDVRKYQKFQTIVKFSLGSPLPAPLSLIYLFIFFYKCFCKDSGKKKSKQGPIYKFRKSLYEEHTKSLLDWAKVTTEAYTKETPKTMEERVEETMKKSFSEHEQKEDDKKEPTVEDIRALIRDTQLLHESIQHNIYEMHRVSIKLAGQRTVCEPCIIYKRCVVCGKLPRYPGAVHYDLTSPRRRQSNESVPRRKSVPLLRHLSEPGGRH